MRSAPRRGAVKLSVVIPTMNEEASIGAVLDQIITGLEPYTDDYEILIVDTASKDRTREIATEKGARVIDEPRRGYGRAYKTGFAAARGDYIATLDADCTYPAEVIPDFCKLLDKGEIDFISGDRLSRIDPGVMSLTHRVGNWGLTFAANFWFWVGLKDSQSGMWVFRRAILSKLALTDDGMPLSEEIKIEAARKIRFKEIPIDYRVRVGEVKLNTWGDGLKNLFFFPRKRFGLVGKAEEFDA